MVQQGRAQTMRTPLARMGPTFRKQPMAVHLPPRPSGPTLVLLMASVIFFFPLVLDVQRAVGHGLQHHGRGFHLRTADAHGRDQRRTPQDAGFFTQPLGDFADDLFHAALVEDAPRPGADLGAAAQHQHHDLPPCRPARPMRKGAGSRASDSAYSPRDCSTRCTSLPFTAMGRPGRLRRPSDTPARMAASQPAGSSQCSPRRMMTWGCPCRRTGAAFSRWAISAFSLSSCRNHLALAPVPPRWRGHRRPVCQVCSCCRPSPDIARSLAAGCHM